MQKNNVTRPPKQIGIDALYSGSLGEIRHSMFHKLEKDFFEKPSLSFKYVLAGKENYIVDGKHFAMEKGQAIFFKGGKKYQGFIDCPKTMGLCIDLNFECLPNASMDLLMEEELFLFNPEFETQRINFLNEDIHALLQGLVFEDASQNPLFFQESLNDLMLQVYGLEKEFVSKMQEVPLKGKNYQKELFKRLLDARNFIHDNQYDEFLLKDIAQESHMSAFYLQRVFKKVFGYSPSEYLEQLRMKEAIEKLKDGMSVKEVCFAIGYNDVSYFCRRFKKSLGITPKQFQKENLALAFSF